MAKLDLPPGRRLRTKLQRYRNLVRTYQRDHVSNATWRSLQYEVLCCYTEGQRAFIDAHGGIIARIRSDKPIREQDRIDSFDLFCALGELYDLSREIEALMPR